MIKITDDFVKKVAEFEGLRTLAYKCPGGVWTIGYGHTAGVKPGQRCTRLQAEAWLREDLAMAAREVEALGLDLAQGQAEALVDFVFNLGIGALEGSTLLKKIRAGAGTAEIQAEFRRWVYAGGRGAERISETPGMGSAALGRAGCCGIAMACRLNAEMRANYHG